MATSTPEKDPSKKDPSEKESSKKEQTSQKTQVDLAVRTPLPGNRPIVPTNKDADIDDFIGYID